MIYPVTVCAQGQALVGFRVCLLEAALLHEPAHLCLASRLGVVKLDDRRVRGVAEQAGQSCFELCPLASLLFLAPARPLQRDLSVPLIP